MEKRNNKKADRTIIKHISISPDRSLLPKLGSTGYSIGQAIAELIDNSIDARLSDKKLTIEISLNHRAKTITISDNGRGMDETSAANCLKLGFSTKIDKLGEFGLGLKSSATSLGERFMVKTTQARSVKEYVLEFDEREWLKNGAWDKFIMKIRRGVARDSHGTTIIIKRLKVNLYAALIGNLIRDLSMRFSPYIENGEVAIKINGKLCKPQTLELNLNYGNGGREPFNFKLEDGTQIHGWRGLLKNNSFNGNYGFNLYRRGRLISQNLPIGFVADIDNRFIVGDLHVNVLPVTFNKREALSESPIWKILNKKDGKFWKFMEPLVILSGKQTNAAKANKSLQAELSEFAKDLAKIVNAMPQFQEFRSIPLKEPSPEIIHGGPEKSIDEIGMIQKDIKPIHGCNLQDISEKISDKTEKEKKEKQEDDKKLKKERKKKEEKAHIFIDGETFMIDVKIKSTGSSLPFKQFEVDEARGILNIYINSSSAVFKNQIHQSFWSRLLMAESVAELWAWKRNSNPREAAKLREETIERVCEQYEKARAQKKSLGGYLRKRPLIQD